MSPRVRALSILREIAYLDPDLDGEIRPLESVWARGARLHLRQFCLSPCIVAVVLFVALMILGVQLASPAF